MHLLLQFGVSSKRIHLVHHALDFRSAIVGGLAVDKDLGIGTVSDDVGETALVVADGCPKDLDDSAVRFGETDDGCGKRCVVGWLKIEGFAVQAVV